MIDDFLGEISSEPGRPKISKERWIEVIVGHANLVPVTTRQGINPFTREPITIKPPPGAARVVVDGEELGSMNWAESGSRKINVFGKAETVVPLAEEVARSLGGRFEPDTIE
jgi:hypothetical protein